jgi:DNA processing protein
MAAGVAADDTLLDPERIARAGLTPATQAYLREPDRAALAEDLQWLASSGARILLCTDATYPPLLAQIASPPAVLFVLGDVALLSSVQLAIVGSRSPTPEGRSNALAFAAWLAARRLTITSGLAVGIDAAGHEGALLAGGRTVAVCGTGLDDVYPTQNSTLARQIQERGALVSEFPPRTPLQKSNFPRRNRIISGLALGTLVVEAAEESGSLITARLAAQQGRRVFAIPGPIHNRLARGCNKLIRDGARLVEGPAEVALEFGISLDPQGLRKSQRPRRRRCELDKEYEMLLDALGSEPATVESIAARTGKTCEGIASMLLILELEGRVAPHPGGRYGRAI